MQASRNGNPVTSASSDYDINLFSYMVAGSREIRWNVLEESTGSNELGPGSLTDSWEITVDVGTVVPRVVFTYGEDVTIERSSDQVTVTASPTILTDNNECNPNWPWTCPEQSGDDFIGYLDSIVTNYNAWDNVAQRNAFYGMDYWTNVGLTSLPPEIVNDPATGHDRLLIRLANHHRHEDGSLFEGFAHLRIPNLFLRRVYGIDDPSTLTGAGLETTGAGSAATVSVVQEPSGDAMLVDMEGLRFSRKRVRISRGVVTPTRPRDLDARRTSPRRGKIFFEEATARGSAITGYRARCEKRSAIVTARGNGSPVFVTGLQRRRAYTCHVRALSKAGPGVWSLEDRMPSRP